MTATVASIDGTEIGGAPAEWDGSAEPCAIAGVICGGIDIGWETTLAGLRQRLACPIVVRAHGLAAIDLDVPGAWASALWQRERHRVALAIVTDEPLGDGPCRDAVAALLGRAAAAVLGITVDGSTPALEARVGRSESPFDEIEHVVEAVEALTIAARMVVMEAEALSGDEALARRYLAQRAAGI